MSKLKTLVLACAAALAMPTLAAAGPGDATPRKAERMALTDAEQDAIGHRHHINVMEIEMGKLAQKRGSPEVKKLAAMLVAEHTKADKDLRSLAKARSITLTDRPLDDDEDHGDHAQSMALMDRLKTMDAATFDREYVTAMVDGHGKELAKVSATLPLVSDAQVKGMLEKTQTSLQKHLDAARALQTKLGGATGTGTGTMGTGTGTEPGTTGTGINGEGTRRGTGNDTTRPGTGTTAPRTTPGTGTTTAPGTGTTTPRTDTTNPRTDTRGGTDAPTPGTTKPGTGTTTPTGTGTTRRPAPTGPDSVPPGPGTEPISDEPIGPTPPSQ